MVLTDSIKMYILPISGAQSFTTVRLPFTSTLLPSSKEMHTFR